MSKQKENTIEHSPEMLQKINQRRTSLVHAIESNKLLDMYTRGLLTTDDYVKETMKLVDSTYWQFADANEKN